MVTIACLACSSNMLIRVIDTNAPGAMESSRQAGCLCLLRRRGLGKPAQAPRAALCRKRSVSHAEPGMHWLLPGSAQL